MANASMSNDTAYLTGQFSEYYLESLPCNSVASLLTRTQKVPKDRQQCRITNTKISIHHALGFLIN